MSFFKEIHRRSLWQILGIYLAASWIVLQVIQLIGESLALPDWIMPVSVVMLLLGLPVVLTTGFVQKGGPIQPRRRATAPFGDPVASEAAIEDQPAPSVVATAPDEAPTGVHHRLFTWRNATVGGVLAFAVVGVLAIGWMALRTLGIGPAATLVARGVLEERDRILVADFHNSTPDTMLASVVTEALRVDLAQSAVVRLVEPSFINQALRRMERSSGDPLDEATARELARREGIKAVLAGDIGSAGSGFVLSARLLVPESGEILASHRETASDADEIISTIDKLSSRMRERMGESLGTLAGDPPLERVTTADVAALQKYTEAVYTIEIATEYERGIELLEEAVALDTAFAMAWRKLGVEMLNRGQEIARALTAITKAYEHRDRLSERERYLATASYYNSVTDEQDRVVRTYETMLERDPEDTWALNNLGNAYMQLDDWGRAEDMYRRSIAVEPEQIFSYSNLINALVAQGKWDAADETLATLKGHAADAPLVQRREISLTAAKGDFDGAREKLEAMEAAAPGDLFVSVGVADQMSTFAAAEGKLAEADRHAERAARLEEQRDLPQQAMGALMGTPFREALLKNDQAAARRMMDDLLVRYPLDSFDPIDRPYIGLTFFYVYAGEPTRAGEMLEAWETEIPPEIQEGARVGHTFAEAIVAIGEKRFRDAIEGLDAIRTDTCPICWQLLTAEAYDSLAMPDSVLALYDSYLNTPWTTQGYQGPSRAIAMERLAQLYDDRGDLDEAARYYAMFVDVWADADEVLQPRVRAAQARLEEILEARG